MLVYICIDHLRRIINGYFFCEREQRMKIKILVQKLDEFKKLDLLKEIIIKELTPYDVKKQWVSDYIPYGNNNGIYFYTKMDEEILYIGKGEYTSKHGLSYRVCSHLGSVNRDSDEMFKYHQWADDETISTSIKQSLKNGDFLVWTLPVEPDYLTSLVEVYLQSFYRHINNCLPPLNKRIG